MRQYSVILGLTFRSRGKDMTSRTRHYGNMGFLKSHSLASRHTSVFKHLASAGTGQNGETLFTKWAAGARGQRLCRQGHKSSKSSHSCVTPAKN